MLAAKRLVGGPQQFSSATSGSRRRDLQKRGGSNLPAMSGGGDGGRGFLPTAPAWLVVFSADSLPGYHMAGAKDWFVRGYGR